ncbi:MAG: DUF1475 family protein [Deltaproteobacteria bacterium]|nr:DUF1475 family protein [Deltaproteobacteria bacterium]
MISLTIYTSYQSNLFIVFPKMIEEPWTVATLWDAYLAFLTFYIWVAYKERSNCSRALWFFLIMGLGNITISLYMLIQLFKLPSDATLEELLINRKSS